MEKSELIKRIKYCGESIMNNAEQIAANYTFTTGLTITCYPANYSKPPEINVSVDFIPEGFIAEKQDN